MLPSTATATTTAIITLEWLGYCASSCCSSLSFSSLVNDSKGSFMEGMNVTKAERKVQAMPLNQIIDGDGIVE
jgi:hypothetical protein